MKEICTLLVKLYIICSRMQRVNLHARPSIIQVGCPTCCYQVCALDHEREVLQTWITIQSPVVVMITGKHQRKRHRCLHRQQIIIQRPDQHQDHQSKHHHGHYHKKFRLPRQFMQLYRSLVRPHLEVSNSAWYPILKQDIDNIEDVQKELQDKYRDLKS